MMPPLRFGAHFIAVPDPQDASRLRPQAASDTRCVTFAAPDQYEGRVGTDPAYNATVQPPQIGPPEPAIAVYRPGFLTEGEYDVYTGPDKDKLQITPHV